MGLMPIRSSMLDLIRLVDKILRRGSSIVSMGAKAVSSALKLGAEGVIMQTCVYMHVKGDEDGPAMLLGTR